MENATDIIDNLGIKRIAGALDITEDAVRLARRRNQIPSAWYRVLCALAGISLPEDAFTFKVPE